MAWPLINASDDESDSVDDELGQPTLVVAARRGDTAEVRRLVAEGEDVNQVNESGHTALMWASYDNHLDIATVLLEHGADLNMRRTSLASRQ